MAVEGVEIATVPSIESFKEPFTLQQATAAGITRTQIRTLLTKRQIRRLARGVYIWTGDNPSTDTSQAMLDGHMGASFLNAAMHYGLWIPPKPHISMRSPLRLDRVHGQFLTEYRQMNLMTLEWTALNLARHQRLPGGLIVFDSALKLGADLALMRNIIDDMKGWSGSRWLGSAISEANPLSESPLESWARGVFIDARIPTPVLQRTLFVSGNEFRPDFMWPDQRLLGEADGEGKYADLEEGRRERRRESLLRREGWDFSRFGWRDVQSADSGFVRLLALKLRRASSK